MSHWFPVGGGVLQCYSDDDGLADGNDCVYLYPDLETALTGKWRSGRMIGAVQAKVTGVYLDRDELQIVSKKLVDSEKDNVYRLGMSKLAGEFNQ